MAATHSAIDPADLVVRNSPAVVPLDNISGWRDPAVTPPVVALPSGMDPNGTYAVDPAGRPGAPAVEDLAVAPAKAASDLSVYGVKGQYAEPTLTPKNGQYATDYYSAYTNDGDFAGAVMAQPGQKIRMIDPATGDVIFEGEGPEGAKQATMIANAVSQEKGRKAAWQIQGDYGEEGWKTQAAERYDPKKQSGLGKLADIALPILGAILAPLTGGASIALAAGLGAAGGSALSSALQGRSLSDTLLRAAISGVGAGVVGPAVGNVVSGLGGAAGAGAGTGAAGALGSAAGSAAGGAAGTVAGDIGGNLLSEVVVQGATHGGLGSLIGAGLGSAAGGALSSSGGANNLQGGQGSDTVQPNQVEEVTVTAERAARQGLTVPQMVALGIPAATAIAAIASVQGGGVTAVDPSQPAPTATGTEGSDIAPVQTDVPGLNTQGPVGPAPPGAMQQALDWAKAHPELVAALLGVAGGAAGGSGGGSYSIPAGAGLAGTRASLDPIFGAKLPASSLAVRQPRDMAGTDWARYGMGPEKSFFTNVPQGLAKGGSPYAVRGPGDGREDKIRADLSDGEYVVDAETVALLGNGSSRAGADKLDRFRVNLRKQKGRDLAHGRFSGPARNPESYFARGRS